MNIIVFGPPGAGKGTQSNNIINDFNLKQISTGDLFRKEIKFQTYLGKKIETLINNGELVPDDIVNELIEKIISNSSNFNKLLFDGYPRTLSQVYSLEKVLNKFSQKISVVFSLNVDQDVIVKRWDSEKIYLQSRGGMPIDCFFHVYGERKDINPLTVEYQGETWEDYPDPDANNPDYEGQNTITG